MVNPYESPSGLESAEKAWWVRLLQFLGWLPPDPRESLTSDVDQFLRGKRLIHYGVVFQVDPDDPHTISAGMPLAVRDQEHIGRNVDEAQRALHQLIQLHPQLDPVLRDRDLAIAMFESYQRLSEIVHRERVPAETWNSYSSIEDVTQTEID